MPGAGRPWSRKVHRAGCLRYRNVPKGCQPSVTVLYQGLAALGLEKYKGRDASGTEMYPGLPALSYRLVPRAGSPACPGLAALGPKKYIGRAASGTEMYLGLSALSYRIVPRAGSPACPGLAALGPESTQGGPPWAQKCTQGRPPPVHGAWTFSCDLRSEGSRK